MFLLRVSLIWIQGLHSPKLVPCTVCFLKIDLYTIEQLNVKHTSEKRQHILYLCADSWTIRSWNQIHLLLSQMVSLFKDLLKIDIKLPVTKCGPNPTWKGTYLPCKYSTKKNMSVLQASLSGIFTATAILILYTLLASTVVIPRWRAINWFEWYWLDNKNNKEWAKKWVGAKSNKRIYLISIIKKLSTFSRWLKH